MPALSSLLNFGSFYSKKYGPRSDCSIWSSQIWAGFYTKLNVWGSLGLNFEYDGGPIIEIGGPIFLDKLRILEGSTSFHEGLRATYYHQ